MKGNLKTSSIAVKSFMAVGILALALTGCMKKELYEPDSGKDDGKDNGKVTLDNYFDFSTTQTVQLNVNYGENCPKAYFEVYAENPLIFQEEGSQVSKREDLIAIAGGFTNGAGIYDKKVVIPASVSEVYIYSPDFGVPKLYKTDVVNKAINATITFDNEIDASTLSRSRVAARWGVDDIKKHIPYVLGGWNNSGKPDYLDPEKKMDAKIVTQLNKYVTTYFPDKNNSNSPYISHNADILIEKDARVWVNFLSASTSALSVFAYYCYNVADGPDEIKEAAKRACVIFPLARGKDGGGNEALGPASGVGTYLRYIDVNGNLSSADSGFPAGTKIGLLIWNNGFKGGNSTFENDVFYSTESLNGGNRTYTALFAATVNGEKYNIISMEDWKNVGSNEPDYNDVAFIISSDPIEAIDIPEVTDASDDRKGTQTYTGLLGFEDNWPEQGDYDMNDVVIKYSSNIDFNSDNKIINIADRIILAWTGADYRNGFSYQVPFDLNQTKVSFYGGENSSVANDNVINVFTDAKKELGVSGIPAGEMPSQNVTEKSFVVTMKFDKPTIDKESVTPPYNPFIKLGNVEVHLTDHRPTSAATNQFPNGADISDGETTFFVCKDGFPFAIHMDARADQSMLNINLKQEGVRIDKTYPGFVDWAKTRDPKTKWWK